MMRAPFTLFSLTVGLILLLTVLAQDDSTCSSTKSCKSGCCSKYGSCGFGPDFCGAGNCTSTCDAKAECGQYAPSGSFNCPLNVCCSQYGFCGTTSTFCDSKCQSGCDKVSEPSCGGSSSDQRTIGYYESWSTERSCDKWTPENIDASLWTHINYAFALVGSDNRISSMNSYDTNLYPRVTALKKMNSGLKVFIAVGGWAAGGAGFSRMVSSASSRATFIQSALAFMSTYDFDGIDIDWEYPAASDRDGTAADKQNFVTFMQELKSACGATYGVTATLPSSYWYMRGFDVVQLEKYVDWFNFMSYDIHGTWDGNSPYTKSVVQPHTNLTEISQGLDLLWRNKINPAKVVLGLGFYGRSFTLSSSSCTTPGCAFSGGADPGECTKTSGILSNAEIQRIIKAKSLKPIFDKAAGVKYMVWNNNQWVSYDDEETLQLKKDFANKHCLGGTMVWALDLDDSSTSKSLISIQLQQLRDIGDDVDSNLGFAKKKLAATQKANNIALATFWTDCQAAPTCPDGFKALTLGHGKVFDAELGQYTANGCKGGPKGFMRALCIEENVSAYNCDWYGKPKKCGQTCPPGNILISQNTHPGGSSSGCKTGYFSSFCCSSIETSTIMGCAESAAGKAISGGLNLRAKSLSSLTNAELFKGSNDLGTLVECAAQAYDNGVVGAVAASIGLLAAGYYTLNHAPGHWIAGTGRWLWQTTTNLMYPIFKSNPCTTTVTKYVEETTVADSDVVTKYCDGNKYPNACYHYSSVSREQGLHTLTCPANAKAGHNGPAVARYRNQRRGRDWYLWVSAKPDGVGGQDKCNRDEYPPFRFLAAPNGNEGVPNPVLYDQWIRFLPGSENSGVAKLWTNLCDAHARKDETTEGGPIIDSVCTEIISVTYKVKAMSMGFINLPYRIDDGMPDNWCNLVSELRVDYGFNLLNDDRYYDNEGSQYRRFQRDYLRNPTAAMINGKTRPRNPENIAKRWNSNQVDFDETIVDEGNSTRHATPEELWEESGLYKCQSENCEEEKEIFKPFMPQPKGAATSDVVVEATATLGPAESTGGYTPSRSRKTSGASQPPDTGKPNAPVETENVELKHRKGQRFAHVRHGRPSH